MQLQIIVPIVVVAIVAVMFAVRLWAARRIASSAQKPEESFDASMSMWNDPEHVKAVRSGKVGLFVMLVGLVWAGMGWALSGQEGMRGTVLPFVALGGIVFVIGLAGYLQREKPVKTAAEYTPQQKRTYVYIAVVIVALAAVASVILRNLGVAR